MTIRFDGRVAIVTGAGNGLGRAHALGLASRAQRSWSTTSARPRRYRRVADGGENGGRGNPQGGGTATADGADVSNFEQSRRWSPGHRKWAASICSAQCRHPADKSFGKMEVADFAKVLDVHLTAPSIAARRCGTACANATTAASSSPPRRPGFTAISARPITAPRRAACRTDERARRGRSQDQHPRQHDFADGGDANDGGIASATGAGADEARGHHAGGGILLSEDAPTRTIMGRAGSFAVIRIMESEGINLPLPSGHRTRSPRICRDQRHVEGEGAGRRVPADPEICRAGRGEGRREIVVRSGSMSIFRHGRACPGHPRL